ncbi:MAG: hypothetical protein JW797_17850 [Bradymonadales bacterium]|nr:hypothetical protein [Bradymonadales bacterium]
MPNLNGTNLLVHALLRLMASMYRYRPGLRRYLRGRDGWMDFSVGIATADGSVRQSIHFAGGKAQVRGSIPDGVDTVLNFKDASVIKRMLNLTPAEVMNLLLRNEMWVNGNMATLNKFNFLLSLLLEKKHKKMMARRKLAQAREIEEMPSGDKEGSQKLMARKRSRLSAGRCDAVKFLEDPYLSRYTLDDFPRLARFLDIHLKTRPEICAERAQLLTDWHREHGFERDEQGQPWEPVRRQAQAFHHLMTHRKPIVRKDDLIAGTTTAKEIGVVLYPDTHGTMIWGELKSVPERPLNPYDISEETRNILHFDVFPYWEKRNIREWVRQEHNEPLFQQLDERFAVYFLWKTVALSHTIADYPKLLRLGTTGLLAEIDAELRRIRETGRQRGEAIGEEAGVWGPDSATEHAATGGPGDRGVVDADLAHEAERQGGGGVVSGSEADAGLANETEAEASGGPIREEAGGRRPAGPPQDSTTHKAMLLESMRLVLEGVNGYADHLADQALADAEHEADPVRRQELVELAEICRQVPRHPARTLHEAIQAIWTVWVALHMENTNAGLSIGRLDQWLQPYFLEDIRAIEDPEERERYVKRAIELVGCFYMRCTDHLPLVPDIGNFLFGGSSSDQAITLGGTTPEGGNAVNDMTYVFLKVTELLNIRDPNVNARFNPQVNSDTYLRRLCEVNLHTAATPSMHNDLSVMASLADFNYPAEHLRDWSATGCVEPTLSGRHVGHTNCMMMNMVAALEMAMNNGRHPLMAWDVGPRTGDIDQGAFSTFEEFFEAFTRQYRFLIEQSCAYNNILGRAHQLIRPTPLLSSLIDGCIASGKDVTEGGARYNSSGSACIGLADVTDSLMAIKTLVYDTKEVSFPDLKRAVAENFANDPVLHATILNKVPKFGSGNAEALELAQRVTRFSHDCYWEQPHYRGGHYTAGFWSMSNHVAFGCLTGALPSGRLSQKPFTPGLTPEPLASKHLLDPIRDVAALDPRTMNNNMAFNVKVVPGPHDSHEQAVDHLTSYARTYFELGGMQMQFNVVTSAILRDAMAHPESYPNLLVRISGYNAYFVTLNRELQQELIERAEYGIG